MGARPRPLLARPRRRAQRVRHAHAAGGAWRARPRRNFAHAHQAGVEKRTAAQLAQAKADAKALAEEKARLAEERRRKRAEAAKAKAERAAVDRTGRQITTWWLPERIASEEQPCKEILGGKEAILPEK